VTVAMNGSWALISPKRGGARDEKGTRVRPTAPSRKLWGGVSDQKFQKLKGIVPDKSWAWLYWHRRAGMRRRHKKPKGIGQTAENYFQSKNSARGGSVGTGTKLSGTCRPGTLRGGVSRERRGKGKGKYA